VPSRFLLQTKNPPVHIYVQVDFIIVPYKIYPPTIWRDYFQCICIFQYNPFSHVLCGRERNVEKWVCRLHRIFR